ncbi:MAG: hypothetical protein WD696_09455 [Bryobacteraceae bacterium]
MADISHNIDWELKISPRRTVKVLFGIVALLALLSLAGQIGGRLGFNVHWVFLSFFDLDGERNVPAWFSSGLLLICSALAGLIGMRERDRLAEGALYWLGLSPVFLFLSLDETVSIHEMSIRPVQRSLETTGVFHFAWVIPAIILLVPFGLLYLRFVLELPAATRRLLVSAGLIYIGGAVGIEMAGGYCTSAMGIEMVGKDYITTKGGDPMVYILLYTMEETLEMTGLSTCIYGLLSHIENYFGVVCSCPAGRQADVARV